MTTIKKLKYNVKECKQSLTIFFVWKQEGVHDAFIAKLQERITKNLVLGDGMDPKVNQGPLINTNQFKRVCNLVDGAKAAGANVVMGGSPKGNLHFQPTIITDVNPGMEVFKDEIFGPVISVIRFKHENVTYFLT